MIISCQTQKKPAALREETFALLKCHFNDKAHENFCFLNREDECFEKMKSIQTYQEFKKKKVAYVLTVNILSNGAI